MIAATYRIQLNEQFGFSAARDLVSYLNELGISHVYASPYFTAEPGSTHGYDLVDPKRLSPELGTEEDYHAWTEALAARGMGHIVDFVPNHMAASPRNRWWQDVLENGPASIYADHFDIEWNPPKEALRGKVLLPVLGAQYGEVLEKGELQLEREGGSFCIRYYDKCFPVNPPTIAPLLERAIEKLGLPPEDPRRQDLESIASGLSRLVFEVPKERAREKEVLKRRLAALLAEDEDIARVVDAEIERMNGAPGDPRSFDDLDQLLIDQMYRLAYWRVATEEINYRRFFEINDLAAIRMEEGAVFDDMHEKLLELVAQGRVQGIRLDHVDGLYDPAAYFTKLRAALAQARPGVPITVIAEKILSPNESLPTSWEVDGTTGYDFLAALSGLFVDPRAEEHVTRFYREVTGDTRTFGEHAFESKRTILRSSLASELQMLALRLERIAMRDRRSRDFTLATLRRAIGETIAAFPVYRTYVRPDGSREPTDVQIVTRAIRIARRKNPEIPPSVFAFLRDQLLFELESDEDKDRAEFAMRFQQLTGPVVAKGVEDTAFYTYVRFVASNEVGGSPDRFGTSIPAFHAMNVERLARWPRAMTATSTHDTKRGEDVRARLAVLSEIPQAFAAWVREWYELVAPYTTPIEEETPELARAPSAADQYLFFQTALGAYPLAHGPDETFTRRLSEYMIKAAREAKQHTSWLAPDDAYEGALRSFVTDVLSDEAFLESLEAKATAIATYGASNGLAQIVLKVASPGVADTYQGSETWDLRLVDPDNRSAVDYARLRADLASLDGADMHELVAGFRDGRVKLHVVSRALRLRRAMPRLFIDGDYRPIDAGDEIVAFVREHDVGAIACAATRLPYRVTGGCAPWACGDIWGDRTIAIPEGRWRDALVNDRELVVGADGIPAAELFRHLPVALLVSVSG
ncbi:MAG: malto-oligosyltrehalose synthase [Myxococcales bacterium 68-20]|nr:MAG: malto-oligosyltrehalose synthase [Myxococcales bacterium 68-20]